jgi:Icc-related predicted phosphoesterase
MRIHPLSDLHLESGAYGLPAGLDCDVVVAPGDLAEGVEGVEFLKTLSVPVIYVPGNHEYWSPDGTVDMEDRLRQIREAARGSNVHVLEKDAVVIDGVRFLGTTLWTDFGGGHKGLMAAAGARMRDYRHIGARKWYARDGNREKFLRFYRDKRQTWITEKIVGSGLLDPYIVFQMHRQALDWLKGQLHEDFDGETVVVTHHHPLLESLRRTGVSEAYLTSSHLWTRAREDDVIPVAAYASDLSGVIRYAGSQIALWVCGHLHTKLDYMEGGARIICNPRGEAIRPYTESEKRAYALYGYPVTAKDEESLAVRLAEDPYMGYGSGFDRSLIVDLDDVLGDVIKQEAEAVREDLEQLRDEIAGFAPLLLEDRVGDPLLVTAVRESIELRVGKFATIFDGLCKRVYENVDGDLWSHIPQMVGERLGLPAVAGGAHFLAQPFLFPGDPPDEPKDEVARLTSATDAAIRSLDLLPRVTQAAQDNFLARLLQIMEKLRAEGIEARYAPSKGALGRWRRLRRDLGSILLHPTCIEMEAQANEVCEQVVNRAWPRVNRDFSVSVVRSDAKYLEAPFDVLYERALTIEHLRSRITPIGAGAISREFVDRS